MNKLLSLCCFVCLSGSVTAQDLEAKIAAVVAEGKMLYRSEMASWYGTDLFMERFGKRDKIGGYFSYTERDTSKCIFYSNDDAVKVIGTISFDSTYNVKTAYVNLAERDFSPMENDLYIIRANAMKRLQVDTIFKFYKDTNPNLIPVISNNEKKVYVLTGPQKSGVVIFGNDYLINYDVHNKLIKRRALHKNIISMEYSSANDTTMVSGMHSHLPETGELMTTTDICTLMLYAKFANWKQHMVISDKYLSIWSCEKNVLSAIPKDVLDKINNGTDKKGNKAKK